MDNYFNHLIGLQLFEFSFYAMPTEFCEQLKAVSSHFSLIKNTVAALSLSGQPIRFICCFKSGFSNSICLLKSTTITL